MKKKKFLILPIFLGLNSILIANITLPTNSFENKISKLESYTIEQVSSGGSHTLMVLNDGINDTLYTWGLNDNGQLGLGDTINRTIPTEVTSLPTDNEILTLYSNSLQSGVLLNNNGINEVYLWGDNQFGELGIGNNTDQNLPVLINALNSNENQIKEIELGYHHTLALINNGNTDLIYSAGLNSSGQLGIGNTTNQNTFQEITALPTGEITTIATGHSHNAAIINTLISGEELYVWGENAQRQLGLGNTTDRLEPTEITGLINQNDSVEILNLGDQHSGIVINDGVEDKLYVTGENNRGQLGLGDTTDRSSFTEVTDPNLDGEFKFLSLGGLSSSTVIKKENKEYIYTWGYNNKGQIGVGDTINKTSPTEVKINLPTDFEVKTISMQLYSCLAIISKDEKDYLYTWGDNTYGQLGISDSVTYSTVPSLALETSMRLPEINLISSNIKDTDAIWTYQILDWGIDESGLNWEYEDTEIYEVVLNGQVITNEKVELNEPINNVGEFTISNLEIDTIYEINHLTLKWGNNLMQTYTIPNFATGDAEVEDTGLPGWEAGIIGGTISIGILLIIGFILLAIFVF